MDVTSRYTRKWGEVLSRRTLVEESDLAAGLAALAAAIVGPRTPDRAAMVRCVTF